jgi:hypothetical protein
MKRGTSAILEGSWTGGRQTGSYPETGIWEVVEVAGFEEVGWTRSADNEGAADPARGATTVNGTAGIMQAID